MHNVFIDFVALLLINMSAGLFILASYVAWGLNAENQKPWVPGFAMPGLVALLCGLYMIWHWPLPGPYNSAFGETSVLLGVLFLGAALALAKDCGLNVVAIYAFLAGLAAIVLGVRIIDLGLTQTPRLSGIGFILSGAGGVLLGPVLVLRQNTAFRGLVTLVIAAAAAIWAVVGYGACWSHMAGFAKWVPYSLR